MSRTKTHKVTIAMNGVTGRMGTNQHLMRSILAIMKEGGVKISDQETIMPDPILVGRNPAKLKRLSELSGVSRWSTDLDSVLGEREVSVYFDARTTDLRTEGVKKAIAAGKHVYCEKPTALTTADALDLWRAAEEAGVKHGVVQDKLWLPGLRKLQVLKETGFFGRILGVRGEFGYWVFPGDTVPAQRPSWNYRKDRGGGIILDMFSHWRYVLDNLIAPVRAVSCTARVHITKRWDEEGKPYEADAEDADVGGEGFATFDWHWGPLLDRIGEWKSVGIR